MKSLFLALLIVSLVIILAVVGQTVNDKSLVLYFPFDEGSGNTAQDKSGNKKIRNAVSMLYKMP